MTTTATLTLRTVLSALGILGLSALVSATPRPCKDGCKLSDTRPNPAGIVWKAIPGGNFVMGSAQGKWWERPAHRVEMSAFDLARSETTVAQYRACVMSRLPTSLKSSSINFPDSQDLLEVLGGLPWQRETPREDPLGSGRIPLDSGWWPKPYYSLRSRSRMRPQSDESLHFREQRVLDCYMLFSRHLRRLSSSH